MKKWDFILIFLLVILSLVPYGIKLTNSNTYDKLYIEVSIKGQVVEEIPLDKYDDKTFDFKSNLGFNTIKIKNNSVEMIHADCPDHYCEQSKPIRNVNEVIVCLPHKLVVKITGTQSNNDSEFDAISE